LLKLKDEVWVRREWRL